MSQKKNRLGVEDGLLTACPKSPNCVSSQSKSQDHYVPPQPYRVSVEQGKSLLKSVVSGMGTTRLVGEGASYLHFEFESAWLKFVDDVEFYFDDKAKLLHFRSASRVGYSDLGANRKRINTILEKLKKSL